MSEGMKSVSNMSDEKRHSSRLASSNPIDFNFESFIFSYAEIDHSDWLTGNRVWHTLISLGDNIMWNHFLCLLNITILLLMITPTPMTIIVALTITYDVVYAMTTASHMHHFFTYKTPDLTERPAMLGIALDIWTYCHYPMILLSSKAKYEMLTYNYMFRWIRMIQFWHRLLKKYLDYSIAGIFLKYYFLTIVLRRFLILVKLFTIKSDRRSPFADITESQQLAMLGPLVNQLFLPIGPDYFPPTTKDRMLLLFASMMGFITIYGIFGNALAQVCYINFKAEGLYFARFKLMLDDMKRTSVPSFLKEKVETYYRMFWHNQRGVSEVKLFQAFPHTVPASIYIDIYFEALQKSPLLCDLSYQFLCEVSKIMRTVHYLPGDTLIKRKQLKSSMYYIAYGDVEIVTAEDDMTPLLRLSRGTILNPCAANPSVACSPCYVDVRAVTYCVVHVLFTKELWNLTFNYGKQWGQRHLLLSSFKEVINKTKKHFMTRHRYPAKYRSSIVQFKMNLLHLREAKDDKKQTILSRNDYFLNVAGSYIVRNQGDFTLKGEVDDICLKSTFPCVWQRESSLLLTWKTLVALVIFIVCFVHPYNIFYEKTLSFKFRCFDNLVTVIFALDLFIHLSTGSSIEEGVPITLSHTSAEQMNGIFYLDILGTLPLLNFVGSGYFAGLNKILRVHKIFTVIKELQGLQNSNRKSTRYLMSGLIVVIVVFLIAASKQGAMCYIFDHCNLHDYSTKNWKSGPIDRDTYIHMWGALLWAIECFTFTNLIIQTGIDESKHVLYSVISFFQMEISLIIFVIILASTLAKVLISDKWEYSFKNCMKQVDHLLTFAKIDLQVKKRYLEYLELCWYTDQAYSITHKRKSIYHDLPPHVYEDMVIKQREEYLYTIPLLQKMTVPQVRQLASHGKLFYVPPNEFLVRTGNVATEILVIVRGYCEVYDPISRKLVKIIKTKDSVCSMETIFDLPIYYTVKSITHVQVMSLSKKDLMIAIVDNKTIGDVISDVKESVPCVNLRDRLQDFIQYEPDPPTPNRQKFPVLRKYESDHAFQQPFNNLGFLSILRYVCPRYTLRPDGSYVLNWEYFRALCAFASAMLYPNYTTLVMQFPKLRSYSYFLDISAYLDILQRLIIGYFNQDGILIYHPATTAAHYIKTAFVVDLFACLPFEYLENRHRDLTGIIEADLTPMNFAQILQFNRLLQLYRLPNAMNSLQKYMRPDLFTTIKIIPIVMVLTNVISSIFIMTSARITDTGNPQNPWSIEIFGKPPNSGNSWIRLSNDFFSFDIGSKPGNLIFVAYFWVFYQLYFASFRIFQPTSWAHTFIIICVILGGFLLKLYFLVTIISIRNNTSRYISVYQEHVKDLCRFLWRENVSEHIKKEALRYCDLNFKVFGGMIYKEVLDNCDLTSLSTEVSLQLYEKTFVLCPFLFPCNKAFLRTLTRETRCLYFPSNTQVVFNDDVFDAMYFIKMGSITVLDPSDDYKTLATMTKGSCFGCLYPSGYKRIPLEMFTITEAAVLRVETDKFYEILEYFPEIKQKTKKYNLVEQYFIASRETSSSNRYLKSLKTLTINKIQQSGLPGLLSKPYFAIYLIVVSVACIFLDVLNAAYELNSWNLICILYVMDLAFVVKILLNFISPNLVLDEDCKIMLENTRSKYIKREFVYDILSCLPFELICFYAFKNEFLFSMFRLNRIFRLATIRSCLNQCRRTCNVKLVQHSLAALLIWYSIFLHISTCLWDAIGNYGERQRKNSSWKYFLYLQTARQMPLNEIPECKTPYLCSFYFVLCTFFNGNVGDIIPRSQTEILFVMVLIMVTVLVMIIFVSEFGWIVQLFTFRPLNFCYYFSQLKIYLKNNHVSDNLMHQVYRYAKHLWHERRGYQVPYLLTNKTTHLALKTKIMCSSYMHHLLQHPAFRDCEYAFLRRLCTCLKPNVYCRDIYVVKGGEICDSMYMVHRGEIIELNEDLNETLNCPIYRAGDYFGTEQGLIRNTHYIHYYKAICNAEVLTLKLKDWDFLLDIFPQSRDSIYSYISPGKQPPQSSPDMTQLSSADKTKISKEEAVPLPKETSSKVISSQVRRMRQETKMTVLFEKPPEVNRRRTLLERLTMRHKDFEGQELSLKEKDRTVSRKNKLRDQVKKYIKQRSENLRHRKSYIRDSLINEELDQIVMSYPLNDDIDISSENGAEQKEEAQEDDLKIIFSYTDEKPKSQVSIFQGTDYDIDHSNKSSKKKSSVFEPAPEMNDENKPISISKQFETTKDIPLPPVYPEAHSLTESQEEKVITLINYPDLEGDSSKYTDTVSTRSVGDTLLSVERDQSTHTEEYIKKQLVDTIPPLRERGKRQSKLIEDVGEVTTTRNTEKVKLDSDGAIKFNDEELENIFETESFESLEEYLDVISVQTVTKTLEKGSKSSKSFLSLKSKSIPRVHYNEDDDDDDDDDDKDTKTEKRN